MTTMDEVLSLRQQLREAQGKISRMRSALLMGVQLAESGGHSARDPQPACPTCHFLKEAREALDGSARVPDRRARPDG